MQDGRQRATTNPDQCALRPCIKGMSNRVADVLDLLDSALSQKQLLEELPDFKKERY